ncbi:MAG: hypothetical protein HN742_10070 [Lentisphaerae bacterium]|jgi:hypothetical protein|nr:hypothetical protein [Lentisphaerota bacterium]MBT4821132.1 hypothetical protein [Lentisphaerota bacterium]MBT5610489.1 hypothetical protein [Lentisphaerota bacterium]MBT7055700.1 hypothetical protein [Lentisphaerota bacterium]MBT7842208.1 hypothetical protein [Lentisphaerota bacterium]
MGLKQKQRGTFSYQGITVLKVILLCGGLALANFLAFDLQFTWDATEGKIHSLAPSTLEILSKVESEVHVTLFATKLSEAAHDLMDKFDRASELVALEFLPINEHEMEARKYGVSKNNQAVVEMGETYRVTRLREENLAGAILQLVKGSSGRILFTSGHGERSLLDQEREGMNQAGALLGQAGYATEQASLETADLTDVCVIVVSGARQDFSAEEVDIVKAFVARGGGLFVMVDPPPTSGVGTLLGAFKLTCADDYVVELNKAFRLKGYGVSTVLVRSYLSGHPVGDRMSQGLLLSHIRSLVCLPPKDGEDVEKDGSDWQRICLSSPNSWGETALGERRVTWDKGKDSPGPRTLVLASPDPPSSSAGAGRIMVAGTSVFAANRFLGTRGNREFFEATVSWLAGDLDYPLVSAKEPTRLLTLSDSQLRWMFVTCVLILPGLSAIVGLIIFVRRARRSN